MTVDAEALRGHWVHSHEEAAGGEQVFRPARHVRRSPGATDRPEAGPGGRWEVEGGALRLDGADGSTQTLQVVSAAPDRLVLRP